MYVRMYHSQTRKGSEVPPRKSQATFAVEYYIINRPFYVGLILFLQTQ